MRGAPGDALREHRIVLDQPEFVAAGVAARGGEGAHRLLDLEVRAAAQLQYAHRHPAITSEGAPPGSR